MMNKTIFSAAVAAVAVCISLPAFADGQTMVGDSQSTSSRQADASQTPSPRPPPPMPHSPPRPGGNTGPHA
jgi:hypothetical protein